MKTKTILYLIVVLSLVAGLSPIPLAAQTPPAKPTQPALNPQGPANLTHGPGTAAVGTLWENGEWDGLNGLVSETNTTLTARAADDFLLDPACPLYNVERIRGQMWDSADPLDAVAEIYADSGGNGPVNAPPLYTFPMSSYQVIGNAYGYPIVEFTFETPGLTLAGDHYWLSVAGIDQIAYNAYFATTGNGAIQLQEGYWKSDSSGYPTWVSDSFFGFLSDLAFDLDGGCATPQPNIVVNPTSLSAEQCPDTQTSQTLQICNTGTLPLEWSLSEVPGTSKVTVSKPYVRPAPLPQTPLHGDKSKLTAQTSGPTSPTPPRNPDALLWDQPTDYSQAGVSFLFPPEGWGAFSGDDFQNADLWNINTIFVPGWMLYGSMYDAAALHWCIYPDAGGTPPGYPGAGGEYWCWSTPPANPAVSIGGPYSGDVTLDVVAGLGAPLVVPPGHWWLVFYPEFASSDSDWYDWFFGLTADGYNAELIDPTDYFGGGLTWWTPWAQLGATYWDLGFRLEGTAGPPDILWLSENPTGGALDPGTCQDVAVTFDSTGLAPGLYGGDLLVNSNDPDTPQVDVPVQMTVLAPPSNADFSWAPPSPQEGDEVTFTATAQGAEPLTYAWDFGDGGTATGNPAAHTYALAGDYLVTLTVSNACGSTVVQHTVTVSPLGCTWTNLLVDNFESGFGNWTMDGLWNPENEADACGSLRAPFPSPTNDAYYGVDGVCNYDAGYNAGSLTLAFDLNLGTAQAADMNFWSWEQTECDGYGDCGYDARIVEVSTDGGATWITVARLGAENVWYNPALDLSAYVGGPLRVRFRFDTIDGAVNAYFGWMVDNVTVRACVADEPDIVVTPESLSAEQCPDTITSQTLQICNDGTQPLTWSLSEQPAPKDLGSTTVTIPAATVTAPADTAVARGTAGPRPETTYTLERHSRTDAPPNVLLVAADDGATVIQGLLQAYGDLGLVDYYDARAGTPTLAQLQAYDVVLTWTNYIYGDPVGMGNVLADYVDVGGKVINLMFSMGTHGWQMQGRFMDQGYTAMNGTGLYFGTVCLGSYNAGHPIMAGVTNVCEFYRTTGTYLTAGSTEIAQWSDGLSFVAAKDNVTVVSINGYVGDNYQWTGQMPDVVHNAILWLGGGGGISWLSETPTSGTLDTGQCTDVTVTFDSTGMAPGDYFANLLIDSNDPETPQVIVPVQLTVLAPPSDAGFSWTPLTPLAGETVTFQGTGAGSDPLTYDWTFGDGGTGVGPVVTHAYGAPGDYLVTLTVSNACGSVVVQHTVTVLGQPDITVTPPSLFALQCPDTITTQTLQICNVGGSALTWSLSELSAPKQPALVPDGAPVTPKGASSDAKVQPFKARIDANNILLITTTDTTQSVEKALTELGYAYDIYYGSPWTGIDFSPYDYVLVGMDGGTAEVADVQKLRTDVIDQGKRLIFLGGTCYQPFAQGMNDYVVGNDVNNYCWQVTNYPQWTVVDPLHPLAAGLPGSYNYVNNSAGFYQIRVSDPAIAAVAVNGEGWPAFFYKGTFAAAGGDFIWYIDSVYSGYWTDPSDYALLKQLIANSLTYNPTPPDVLPWLSEAPTSGTLLPGECTDVTVTFDSTGLVPGTYLGDLRISSNDPDTPQVTVPVQMTVQECNLGSLHLWKTKMVWAGLKPPSFKVVVRGFVHDQDHALAAGVTVSGFWTYPDGSVHPVSVVTDALGRWKSAMRVTQCGLYQFDVTGLSKAGYAYNPGANETNPHIQIVVPCE